LQQAKTKMKQIIYVLSFLTLTSCGQSNSEEVSKAESKTIKVESKVDSTKPDLKQNATEQIEQNNQDLRYEFKEATIYKLTDTINADFNGDGNADQAIFKKENETSGIIITHGGTNQKIKVGFGESFAHLTEFNWVDYWGLINDSETYEIVIKDTEIIEDREVTLDNPSIVVRKEEVGGGLITFKDKKYIWIHQAD
jgi:hypothetical protein